MTSAFSGPRLQSPSLIGEIGAAVGGEGPGVSVGTVSVGIDVGPSAGGVLVLVGSAGEEVDVDPEHADRSMIDTDMILTKVDPGIWANSL